MNTARMAAEIVKLEGWTQSRLADYCGVSQATVSRWVKGQDPEGPNRDKLRDLYDLLIGQPPTDESLNAERAKALAIFDGLPPAARRAALAQLQALAALAGEEQ
jgi:transcriptional regulator with XRE-family HTH domain